MDEHELAWAAGFFDGDGWAALVRDRGRYRPMARINQSDPDGVPQVLTRFRAVVGVGAIHGPKREPGLEDAYQWVTGGQSDVERVGSLLAPWLCGEKRAQFMRVSRGINLSARRADHLRPWAGGFFDAEGSTSLSDHRSHAGYKVIEANATQSGMTAGYPEELVRFVSVIGVGRNYGPYVQAGAVQLVYRWRAHTADDVRVALHLLQPWIGDVKRNQAVQALAIVDSQPNLPRGRVEWGAYKTHCIHGHEYATARMRPYVSRGATVQPRQNKQCLACAREQARARREAKMKIGDLAAADLEVRDDDATC